MNTKPDPLEHRLQSLPVRTVPAHWRPEILRAAHPADRIPESRLQDRPGPWWRAWLWPCPEAWAGMAVLWCLIFALNLGVWQTERRQASLGEAPPPAPMWMGLEEQRRLLAELEWPRRSTSQQPPPVVPRPRSCRRLEQFIV